MTTTLPTSELGVDQSLHLMKRELERGQSRSTRTVVANLEEKLELGTASLDEVEDFLRQSHPVPDRLKPGLFRFLKVRRGWARIDNDRAEEALAEADAILAMYGQTQEALGLKAASLLNLQRFPEACQAFKDTVDLLVARSKPPKTFLGAIVKGWSGCALLWGLNGIINEDPREATAGVDEYLRVKDLAAEQGLKKAMIKPMARADLASLPEKMLLALEELEMLIRLLSIKDPFHRWREFSKEISKVWPKDISAVEAIREQRR